MKVVRSVAVQESDKARLDRLALPCAINSWTR